MSLLLEDVTLTYPDGAGRLTALDGVGLEVPAGTMTAVVGPSGSGKSSLLAVAATLVTPERGRVVVDGVDTATLSRAEKAELRRRRLGIVFQQPNLLGSLTALEQLELMAHVDGRRPGGRVRERARGLLAAVGLADQA
ncbi:ATP-binding cassette domain-containing protein, partial [Streptomyces sp. NPDC005904]|uniref:ATP-binding cassette domain-containing protein n=1 Tax=Streptomyces sp. NPDC005904 TaxID=3154570 RepID=UPI003409EA7D